MFVVLCLNNVETCMCSRGCPDGWLAHNLVNNCVLIRLQILKHAERQKELRNANRAAKAVKDAARQAAKAAAQESKKQLQHQLVKDKEAQRKAAHKRGKKKWVCVCRKYIFLKS